MKTKLLNIALGLSVFSLLVENLRFASYWRFIDEMLSVTYILVAILYATRYMNKDKIALKDTLKLILVFAWCLLSVLDLFYIINFEFVLYFVMLLGVFWYILEWKDILKQGLKGINLFLLTGVSLLGLQTLMTLQFWPFRNLVFAISLLVISVGFFVDSYFKRTE